MAVTIRENDVKASNLLLLSYGLTLVSIFVQLPPSYEKLLTSRSAGVLLAGGILTLAYLVGLALGVRRGYRWVKIFFVLAIAWDIIRYTTSFPPAEGITLKTSLFLLATLAKAWAFFLVARDLLRQPAAGNTKAVARPAD